MNFLEDNRQKRDFLTLLECYNFKHLISDVTFVRNNSESCLDNFITNISEHKISGVRIDHNGLGDGHAGIFCTLEVDKVCSTRKCQYLTVERRLFNQKSKLNFRYQIMQQDWSNMGINQFISRFTYIFKNSFKKTKSRIKTHTESLNRLRWVTKGIRVSSKMKRHLSMLKWKNNENSKYRCLYMNIYNRVIRQAKRLAIVSEINKATNSSKAIWKVVNKQRNKFNGNVHNNIILKVEGKLKNKPGEVADAFSEEFYKKNICNNHNIDSAVSLLEQGSNRVENSLKIRLTSPREVMKTVQEFEVKHSYGHDEIPITIIKEHVDILAEPLSIFYNNCLLNKIFPEQLKIARVVPIHKSGSRTDSKKYRPISLLPTLSKIFEKLIKKQLSVHLYNNNVIHKRQFGYQRNIGTIDAVDLLVDDVITKLNKKLKVAGIFLDLSAAFDTVDHAILLKKLEYYGIRGDFLELLTSYLKNRKQFVEIVSRDEERENTYKSKLVKVERGVPQGSILGPLLFIVFTNDLIGFIEQTFPDTSVVVFADDTNAIVNSNNIESLSIKTNALIMTFDNWFRINNLTLNADKTNAMLFKTTSRNNDALDIYINNNKINQVNSVKFLGIHIDSKLNWKVELESVSSTISSACYAIRSLRDELGIIHLKQVYYALVESKLRYSIRFWGRSYDYNFNRAFVLQKRAIRTMVRISQRQSCREVFIKLGILTLPCLYILVVTSHLVKYLPTLESELERNTRLQTRRKDLKSDFCPNIDIAKHSPRFQALYLYNNLPTEFKELTAHRVFNNKLKLYLLKKCYYSFDEFINDKADNNDV